MASNRDLNKEGSANTDLRRSASVVQRPETAGATAANDAAVAGDAKIETAEEKEQRLAREKAEEEAKRAEEEAKRARNFSRIIQEVMTTENTFINNMKDFHSILEGMLKEKITSDQRDFIQSLRDLTQSLIESSPLYGIDVNGPNLVDNIVVAMLKTNDQDKMKTYIEKMKLFAMMLSSSAEIFRDSELQSTYDKVREDKNLHTDDQKKFDSFFIQPIQRGPRFALLLREMVKNSDAAHEENFKKIEDNIKKELDKLNEAKREVEGSEERRRLETSKAKTSDSAFTPQEPAIALAFMKLYSAIYTSAATTGEEKAKLVNELTDLLLKDKTSLIEGFIRIANSLNINIDRILANQTFEKEDPLQNIRWPFKLSPRVAADESIKQTKASFDEIRKEYIVKENIELLKDKAELALLTQELPKLSFKTRVRLAVQPNFLTDKMKRYQEKISYIKLLDQIDFEFEHYKKTVYSFTKDYSSEDPSSLQEANLPKEFNDPSIREHAEKWKTAAQEIPAFATDVANLQKTINKIKCNDADIVRLRQMEADLKYNKKYKGTYKSLRKEIRSELKKLTRERDQNYAQLVKDDKELSERFQLALIAREQDKSEMISNDDIRYVYLPWDKDKAQDQNTPEVKLELDLRESSPFMTDFNNFKKYADGIGKDEVARLRLLDQQHLDHKKLAEDIARYNVIGENPSSTVRSEHQAHLQYVQDKLDEIDSNIRKMPKKVSEYSTQILKSLKTTWNSQNSKDLEAWPLEDQVKTLREACEIMLAMYYSQKSLSQVLGKAADYDEVHDVAFLRLSRVILQNGDLKKLFATDNPNPADQKKAAIAFKQVLNDFASKAEYAALPKQIKARLDDLSKTISHNFDRKPSLFARFVHFVRKSDKSDKKTPAKRMSAIEEDSVMPDLPDERERKNHK